MCEYCNEDFEGYYRPLDKNAHVCVFDTPHEKILDINWYGHKMKININYCPMCGIKLPQRHMVLLKKANTWGEKKLTRLCKNCYYKVLDFVGISDVDLD